MSKQITLLGKQVNVSLKKSEKAEKTVKVEIKSEKEVTIQIPEGKKIEIDSLLKKHENLLEKKYSQFLNRKPILKDKNILYKGKYHKLEFQLIENNSQKEIVLEENKLTIFHRQKSDPYRILKEWMKNKTKKLVEKIERKYADQLREPLIIRVAETTRWGYTRKNGVIVINWQLVALPLELSEYVIVHEFTHLSKMNHRKKFQYKLAQIIPNYRIKEKNLKKYQITTKLNSISK